MNFYEALKNKLFKKVKKYVVDTVIDSDFLRETSSVIPLTLVSVVTRNIFNFLVTWRFATGNRLIDFFTTCGVSVIFTLLAPMFNNIIQKSLEIEAKDFMDEVIINLKENGWIYFDMWKNRILGTIGVFSIGILFFVEIDSLWIQETIVSMIITTVIVDYLNNNIAINMNDNNIKETVKLLNLEQREILENYGQTENADKIVDEIVPNSGMIKYKKKKENSLLGLENRLITNK